MDSYRFGLPAIHPHSVKFALFARQTRQLRHSALCLLAAALLLMTACSKDRPSEDDVRGLLKIDGPIRVLMNKKVNLLPAAGYEHIVVVQASDHETVSIIRKNEGGDFELVKKISFYLPAFGYYRYAANLDDWIPAEAGKKDGEGQADNSRVGNLITRLTLKSLPPQKTNAIIFSYLSRPNENASITENIEIWQARPAPGGQGEPGLSRVFDYRSSGKVEQGSRSVKYRLLEDGTLVTEEAGNQRSFLYNGLEFIEASGGQPLVRLYEADLVKSTDGNYSFSLNMKNKTAFARNGYVSISIEGAAIVQVEDSKGVNVSRYETGQLIYSFAEKKKVPSKMLMVELEKTPWAKNHRAQFKVQLKPEGDKPLKVYLRIALKTAAGLLTVPSENSLYYHATDQQGMPAWVFTPSADSSK